MAANTGVDSQVLSLPKGGGAVQGLSGTFETDLNTGTGSFTLPIDVPAGPNGVRPAVSIRYHSAAGNGPFGVGWTFGLMSVGRKVDGRIPDYGPDDDAFTWTGAEDLVRVAEGRYRPKVDALHWRLLRGPPAVPDGWEATDTRGTVYRLGGAPGARVEIVEGGLTKTALWLLESMTDSNGNRVGYTYLLDGRVPYLSRIDWGTWSLRFTYEARPDVLTSGRYGFLQRTALRCARIELHGTDLAPTLVRSWSCEYAQAPGSGLTLLHRVVMAGHAADGSTLSSPPVTLRYTEVGPRDLKRFAEVVPGASPTDLGGGRIELLDWDGDGLPDLLELREGLARVWPNRGRCRWGTPRALPQLPSPLSLDEPGVAFADMDGTGTADLVLLDRPLGGYYPHLPGGGFGRPVHFSRAPASHLTSGEGRLVDLDGDGVTDLLVSSDHYFTLYFYDPETGWSDRPMTVPRSQVPPVSLADPRVRLADMNGDGLDDLVRVDGHGVVYWPYFGNGRWGDAVALENPPALPRNFDARRLHVVDVDGDGCADLVYVDLDRVVYWLNQGGSRLGPPVEIACTPPADASRIRVADMTGNGTAGVLWSMVVDGERNGGYFFLDLTGGVKPYLLCAVDNGVGLETRIGYRSSTEYAVDAADAGAPWKTFHPFPMQCVASMELHDQATGQTAVTRYTYHDGRYDPVARTFLGYSQVETEQTGDETIDTAVIRNTYHVGLDPADPLRPLDGAERGRLGALRRRLLRTEVYGRDGSPDQDRPYQVVRHEYAVREEPGADGQVVYVAWEKRTTEERWERGAAPFSTRTVDYGDPDEFGNLPHQRMVVSRAGAAVPDADITTDVTFAKNVAANVVSLPARITQKDGAGQAISVSVTRYDGPAHEGLPEGSVTLGNVTRVDKLALADAMVTAVYGTAPPDFAALGYHRLAGEGGWWIRQNSYERIAGPPQALVTRGPRGFQTRMEYDASGQYAVKVTDATGAAMTAQPERRCAQTGSVTEANGHTTRDLFDALGRVAAIVNPGDTDALPSTTFQYLTGAVPAGYTSSARVRSGEADVLSQAQYFTGRGQSLQQVMPGEGDAGRKYIVSVSRQYTPRGQVAAVVAPYYRDTLEYAPPPASQPRTTMRYDATGRLRLQRRPDGATVEYRFQPGALTVIESSGPADPNPRRSTQRVDGLDRVLTAERPLGAKAVATTFTYDSLNRIATTRSPDGAVTALTYDLAGRLLVDEGVDTGRTVNVIDAAGNQVRRTTADGKSVIQVVDELERVVETREDGAATPEVAYTYLRPGEPAPPDGARNRLGRLWKVVDRLGTLTTAYDGRGQVVETARAVDALGGRRLVTSVEYDALGRQVKVTLPEPESGAGRRIVGYVYGPRGLPVSSPAYVKATEYDVEGRITRLAYQNGTEDLLEYDALVGRPKRLRVMGPGGETLRDQALAYDSRGNLAGITAADAVEGGTFQYDDLERLVKATYASGELFQYAYSDGGNVLHADGVGDLTYSGAAGSGAVTAAGGGSYTYDAAGRMKTAPYGALQFNAFDNLVKVTAGDAKVDYAYDFNGLLALRRSGEKATIYADPHVEYRDGKPVVWISFNRRRILGVRAGAATWLHVDMLGSSTLFTDDAGKVIRRLAFGPYGTLRFDSAGAGGAPGDIRYGGQPFDELTGLVAMGRRFYDPRLGRFVTPDAAVSGVFVPDGWNRYAYAHGNPLRFSDPSGLFSFGDFLAVVAVVVVVAALVVASVATAGVADLVIAGVSVSISGMLATTAVGVAAGAILGGIAAAKAGGDIWKGVLLGGLIGGVAGFIGGALSAWTMSYPLFGSKFLATIAAGAISGAVTGAGTGAAIGYAGGAGSAESVWKNMVAGAIMGAITGALCGFVTAGLKSTSVLRLGNFDKFNPSTAANGDVMDKVNYFDNSGSVGQDLTHTAATGKWSAITEFVNVGEGSQEWSWANCFFTKGTIISIPVGWVPSAAVTYGGISAVTALSIAGDKFGGSTFAWDNQILFLFNAFPFVGIALGFGFGEGGYGNDYEGNTGWYDSFKGWIHDHFGMHDL